RDAGRRTGGRGHERRRAAVLPLRGAEATRAAEAARVTAVARSAAPSCCTLERVVAPEARAVGADEAALPRGALRRVRAAAVDVRLAAVLLLVRRGRDLTAERSGAVLANVALAVVVDEALQAVVA